MNKSYINDKVQYSSHGKIWQFEWNVANKNHQFLLKAKGSDNARKVSNIINGAIKRGAVNGLDGMARENINRMYVIKRRVLPIGKHDLNHSQI